MTADATAGTGSAASTSSSLLKRIRQRDSAAWERLTELYGPLVYSWCRDRGLTPEDASDIFQEVFTAVTVAIGDFRRKDRRGAFRAWLKTITLNKIRDFYRRQQVARATGGSDAQHRIAEIADPASRDACASATPDEQQMFSALLHRALESVRCEFEERTWQAFWRTTLEDKSTADVADELGITSNAVRQYCSRVLRRLRQELKELEET